MSSIRAHSLDRRKICEPHHHSSIPPRVEQVLEDDRHNIWEDVVSYFLISSG